MLSADSGIEEQLFLKIGCWSTRYIQGIHSANCFFFFFFSKKLLNFNSHILQKGGQEICRWEQVTTNWLPIVDQFLKYHSGLFLSLMYWNGFLESFCFQFLLAIWNLRDRNPGNHYDSFKPINRIPWKGGYHWLPPYWVRHPLLVCLEVNVLYRFQQVIVWF